jgi:hypothetical protein
MSLSPWRRKKNLQATPQVSRRSRSPIPSMPAAIPERPANSQLTGVTVFWGVRGYTSQKTQSAKLFNVRCRSSAIRAAIASIKAA